jgi:hypothetical protein
MTPLLGSKRGSGALARARAQIGNALGFGSKKTRRVGRWRGMVTVEGPRIPIIGKGNGR